MRNFAMCASLSVVYIRRGKPRFYLNSFPPAVSIPGSSAECEPGRDGGRLVLGPPRPRQMTPQFRDSPPQLHLRPLQLLLGDFVKITFAPDCSRQLAPVGGRLHDAAEQLSFQRMNADVVVGNSTRIDQAADDDADGVETAPGLLLFANERVDGLPPERFDRRHELVELRPGFSRRARRRVIR